MSSENSLPADLLDAVHEAISPGKKLKLVISQQVSYEIKPGRQEQRVLALSKYRLYVLLAKIPSKVEHNVHFLDIQSLESQNPTQLRIGIDAGKKITVIFTGEGDSADGVITHIGTTLKGVFPQSTILSLIPSWQVSPESRLQAMNSMAGDLESKDAGPCGGFSQMYACTCDQHSLPYRDEVSWDVDTIYLSQGNRELNLADFDHMDGRDLIPIIATLEHNTYFTKLKCSNVRLCNEAANQVLKIVKKNSSLEELWLSNSGLKGEVVERLLARAQCPLHTLDLSHNVLEEKGTGNIWAPLSKLPRGLVYLNLCKTGLTAKGVNLLSQSLCANKRMVSTLTTLNLSGNSFKGEEINNLHNFLAQPNTVTTLNLSGSDCALDTMIGALVRGCAEKIQHLDLSYNSFTHKRARDVSIPLAWNSFFSTVIRLESVNVSGCKLPTEAVRQMLSGLAKNKNAKQVEVNMSSIELRANGAKVLAEQIPALQCVSSLDISENALDQDIVGVVKAVMQNKHLKKLSIGRNFNNTKAKHLPHVLGSVVEMIQDDDAVLQSLSLADSKLKMDTEVVISALGSNRSLTELDVSGNMMGDMGARVLAKALQINTRIETLYWDRNATTAQGFSDIAAALQKNYTLKKFPTPLHDASIALKTQQEKTETALQQIEALLQRNHCPRKFESEQAYRLQHGLLVSSTQQMVDRLVVKVQDTINDLNTHQDLSPVAGRDISVTSCLILDADAAKQFLPKAQEVALKSEAEGNNIDTKLQKVSTELHEVIEAQLQQNVANILKCAELQCPSALQEGFREELHSLCKEKVKLPEKFAQSLVMEQVGTDVMNKVSELNVSVASLVSDRLIDRVLDLLETNHKTLTDHLNEHQQEPKDLVRHKGKQEPEPEQAYAKKKSLYNRRLRPQSVIVSESSTDKTEDENSTEGKSDRDVPDGLQKPGGQNGRLQKLPSVSSLSSQEDLLEFTNVTTKETSSSSIKKSSPPTISSLAKDNTCPMDSLDVLPVCEVAPRLQHLGKDRPKRAKTRAIKSSRATTLDVQTSNKTEQEENVDEGVENFFDSKPVSKDAVIMPTQTARQISSERQTQEESKPVSSKSESPKKKGFLPFGDTKSLKEGFSKFWGNKKTSGESGEEGGKRSATPENELNQAPVTASDDDISGPDSRSEDELENAGPEEQPAEIQPPKPRVRGVGLPGMGVGGGALLGELRTRQAKRESVSPAKGEDKDERLPVPRVAPQSRSPGSTRQPPQRPSPGLGERTGAGVPNGSAPTAAPRMKPPPTKPKPPVLAPKPRPTSKPVGGPIASAKDVRDQVLLSSKVPSASIKLDDSATSSSSTSSDSPNATREKERQPVSRSTSVGSPKLSEGFYQQYLRGLRGDRARSIASQESHTSDAHGDKVDKADSSPPPSTTMQSRATLRLASNTQLDKNSNEQQPERLYSNISHNSKTLPETPTPSERSSLPQRAKSVYESSGAYGPIGFKSSSEPRAVLAHQLRGLGRVNAPTTTVESSSKTDEDKLAASQTESAGSSGSDNADSPSSAKTTEPIYL